MACRMVIRSSLLPAIVVCFGTVAANPEDRSTGHGRDSRAGELRAIVSELSLRNSESTEPVPILPHPFFDRG